MLMLATQTTVGCFGNYLCKLIIIAFTETDEELKFKWMDVLKSYYISGLDKKTLNNFNVDDCKKACENEKGFKCKSFDYLPAYKRCYLQEANRRSSVLKASASYYYYEIDYEGMFHCVEFNID